MATELILLEDVENLGQMGEVVTVSPGYARNFLLPRKLATKAHPGALRQLAARQAQLEEQRAAETEAARELAGVLTNVSLTIPVQATEDEKLYGSVTAHAIAEALQEMHYQVDAHQVVMPEPIRKLGTYTVDVQLHPDVAANVKVWVVKA